MPEQRDFAAARRTADGGGSGPKRGRLRRAAGLLPASALAVGGGKLATAAANVIALVVAGHALSADEFGVFGGVLAAAFVLGRALTLGVDHALLRLRATPPHAGDETALTAEAASAPAAASAALLLALGLLAAMAPQVAPLSVWATVAAAAGWSFTEVAYWSFLARRRFGAAVATQAGMAGLRLLAVIGVGLAIPSLPALLAAWSGVGLAFGAASLIRASRGAGRPRAERLRALLRYGRWQGFAQTLAALGAHQGVLLLLLVGGREAEAGALSLAMSLSFGVFLLHQAVFEHLALDSAHLEPEALPRFFRRSLATTGGVAAIAAAALAAVHQLGGLVLPPEIWRDGDAFVGVAVFALLGIAHAPFEAALHGRLHPRPIFVSRALRLAIMSVAGPVLALEAGATAMGWLYAVTAGASLAYVAAASGALAGSLRPAAAPASDGAARRSLRSLRRLDGRR